MSVNIKRSLDTISNCMTWFVQKIKSDNAMGLLDINQLSEDVLIPLFAEVYGYTDLSNLNVQEANYPGIDLGDESAQVAFQITSRADSTKVKNTLKTFVEREYYREYDRLVIYVITEKQGSYAGTGWDEIVGDRFVFSREEDIRDYRDLLRQIRHLPIGKVERVKEILERHLVDTTERVPVDELLDAQLHKQLTREKNSGRYIPGILVEVAKIKDEARFFAHPTLFYQKVLDEVFRLQIQEVNRFLRKLSLEPIRTRLRKGLPQSVTLETVYEHVSSLGQKLDRALDVLQPYYDLYWRAAELDDAAIPEDKEYVYRKMKWRLGMAAGRVTADIKKLLSDLRLISSRVLFIVGRAGQGKTNFICDFAERVLLKRSIPCVLFTGRDFSHVMPERIGEYFTQSVFGNRIDNLGDALCCLDEYAVESNAPVVIIVDGINENRNIEDFSHHLERFVERVLDHEYIKVVLTCRSEYFEERFGNFRQASFAHEIQFIKDFERYMSEAHKDRILDVYFDFFNLSYPYMAPRAAEVLKSDTLLLRMFCEAYGDMDAEESIQLPQIVDIYRDTVFREYLDRKIAGAAVYRKETSPIRVGLGDEYHRLLGRIVQLMVQGERYSDIPVADLEIANYDALAELLGEDVIVRRDLVTVDNVLSDKVEVINFTFDEFRDFLLANHLVTVVFRENRQRFEQIIDRMVAPNSPVAEGVRTYLFLAAKRTDGRHVHETINQKEWYGETFVKSIFSVEEEFITQEDLDEIKASFHESRRNASWILRLLVWRWRTSWYPRLNIHLLFELLDELDGDKYDELVRPGVSGSGIYGYDGSRSWTVTQLTTDIDRYLDDEFPSHLGESVNLIDFLVYLFPILGEGTYSSPAFQTFARFAELKPDAAVSILRKHTQIRHLGIRVQVWRMLSRIARDNPIPSSLGDEACQLLVRIGDEEPHRTQQLGTEIARFLEICAAEHGADYGESVDEAIPVVFRYLEPSSMILETDFRLFVVFDRHYTLAKFRVASRVRSGSYAEELVERIYDCLFGYSRDVSREYERYYAVEYPDFADFLYWKYGIEKQLADRISTRRDEGAYVGYGRDTIGMFSDETVSCALDSILSKLGEKKNEDQDRFCDK